MQARQARVQQIYICVHTTIKDFVMSKYVFCEALFLAVKSLTPRDTTLCYTSNVFLQPMF